MKVSKNYRGGVTRFWWIPLFTGLFSIALGVWALFSPQTSLPVFAYIFAGILCASGFLNIVFAGNTWGYDSNWGWSLFLGIIELICGIWMFTLPETAMLATFIYIVGVWIFIAAINAICESCMLSVFSPAWIVWMVIFAIATAVFAAIFLSSPILGGMAIWLWLGISLISFGIYRMILANKIRALNNYVRDWI